VFASAVGRAFFAGRRVVTLSSRGVALSFTGMIRMRWPIIGLTAVLLAPTRVVGLLQGVVLVGILLNNGLTSPQIVIATAVSAAATTVGSGLAFLLTRALERRRRGRLAIVVGSAAALVVLIGIPLSAHTLLGVCLGLAALRTALAVFGTHRSLLIIEWLGVARAGEYILVGGLVLGLLAYLTRTALAFLVLRGGSAVGPITILVVASMVPAMVLCVVAAFTSGDQPTPRANRLGDLMTGVPAQALRASNLPAIGWLWCAASFALATTQTTFLPALVEHNGRSPYQLTTLGILAGAGALTWAWLPLRRSFDLITLPWLGLIGTVVTAALLLAGAPPAAVAFTAGIALAGIAAIFLATMRTLAGIDTDEERSAVLIWVSLAAALSTALGLGVAVVDSSWISSLAALIIGVIPFALALVCVLVLRRVFPSATLQSRRLLRLWLRQFRLIVSTRTPLAPATRGQDLGRWIRGVARQFERHLATSTAPRDAAPVPDSRPTL
jgi:hypothetical protein